MIQTIKLVVVSFVLLSSFLKAQDIYIAVIGGTSFGAPLKFGEGLVETEREFEIETPAGMSPTIYQMRYAGVPFYYIPMYGNLDLERTEPEYLGLIRSFAAFHELGIRYASISSVANPAVGVRPFTFAEMQDAVQMIADFTIPVVLDVIARIPEEAMEPEPSSTGDAYTGAYTDPDAETD